MDSLYTDTTFVSALESDEALIPPLLLLKRVLLRRSWSCFSSSVCGEFPKVSRSRVAENQGLLSVSFNSRRDYL